MAKVKPKMIYASSKDELKKRLVGIACEIQGSDQGDVEYDEVCPRAKSVSKCPWPTSTHSFCHRFHPSWSLPFCSPSWKAWIVEGERERGHVIHGALCDAAGGQEHHPTEQVSPEICAWRHYYYRDDCEAQAFFPLLSGT